MRNLFLCLFAIFGLLIPAFSQNTIIPVSDSIANLGFNYQRDFRKIQDQSQDKTSPYYYKKLLIRFLDNDSSLSRADVLALMIGFTLDPNYKPFKDMQTEKEIFDLNDHGQYQDALDESKSFLQKHPLSLRILKERSYAYHQLYKKDSADYFMGQVDKIMGAMIYSGKGKSMDKAIFSLGLNDGEHFIANIGMSVNQKSTTWDRHRNFIFIVNAMDNEGTFENWYFNIQHAKVRSDDEGIDEDTPMDKKKKKKKKGDKPVDKKAKDKGWGGENKDSKKGESTAPLVPDSEKDRSASDTLSVPVQQLPIPANETPAPTAAPEKGKEVPKAKE